MTNPNTSYAAPEAGGKGALAYLETPHVTLSRVVETAAGIGFGLVVSRGTDKDKQIGVGGAVPFGITLRGHEYGNDGADEAYDLYDMAPVLRSGYVWVYLTDSGSAGSTLHYNTTTGVIGLGSASTGEALLPGELISDCAGTAYAIIYIDCHVCSVANILTSAVVDTDYTPAYSLLAADTINTPAAVTLAASQIVGRKATGGIVNMTMAELKAILGTNATTAINSNVSVLFENIAAQTDESQITAALDGSATSYFVPTGYVIVVKDKTGTVAGDGTINIGTTTGGAQYESAQALTGLDTIGDAIYVPINVAVGAAIAGNANVYFNIEAADSTASTLVLNCLLFGKQVSIA
jgi:hypothetical protein